MKCPECGAEYREEFESCAECRVKLVSDEEYRAGELRRAGEDEQYRHLEMVLIHSAQGQIEADIIRSYLLSHGIKSITRGLAVQSVHPFTVDGMGEIKILVSEKDAEEARQVMASYLERNNGASE